MKTTMAMESARLLVVGVTSSRVSSFRFRSVAAAAAASRPSHRRTPEPIDDHVMSDHVTEMTTSNASRCPMRHQTNNDQTQQQVTGNIAVRSMHELDGPIGWPLVGNFLTYLRKENRGKMHEVQARQHKMYGPMFREKWGTKWQVHVADPRLIEDVYRHDGRYPNRPAMQPWVLYRHVTGRPTGLFTAQGKDWYTYRTEFGKRMLNRTAVGPLIGPINDVTNDLVSKLRQVRDHDGELALVNRLAKEMYNWSMEAAGSFLFETRLGCLQQQIPLRTRRFVSALQDMFSSSLYVIVGDKLHQKLNTTFWRRHADAWDRLFSIAKELVDERRAALDSGRHHVTATGGDSEGDDGGVYLTYLLSNDNINLDQIYSNLMEMLIAGTDTTANSFCFIVHLLATNPAAFERLCQEVETVLEGRSTVTASDVDRLHYVKCIIKEALRLYPAATMNCRILSEDIVLGGYLIPKDTLFVLNHYASARDDQVFAEAERFIPERWLRVADSTIAGDVCPATETTTETPTISDGELRQHHAFGCLPFGYGTRSCLGRRAAMLELTVALVKVAQNFRLEPYDGVELQPTLRTLLTPGDQVPVRFVDRK